MENELKLVEWDALKHLEEKEQTEIKNGVVAAFSSVGRGKYLITVFGDKLQIFKTGFNDDQIKAYPRSSNVIQID